MQVFTPLLPEKIRILTRERRGSDWIFKKTSQLHRPFWIHAASGEIEYARPLIRELKKKFPEIPVVVTYSSPSAKKILEKISELDAWGPAPWDTALHCQKFFLRLQARALFIARTDVWPNLIYEAKKMQVPSLLFSATFAENSSRFRGLSKYLNTYALSLVDHILVASSEDLKFLKRFRIHSRIQIGGDTRYDQVLYRLNHPQPLKISKPNSEITLVAGSTWPEDEAVLLPWYEKHQSELRLILAPHEVSKSHLENIREELEKRKIRYDLYSQCSSEWNSKVLIIDQIGILAEVYQLGDFAFIGGSFKKQVHSVMEALAAGLPVVLGPYHLNNREALQFKSVQTSGFSLVQVIHNSQEMKDVWENLKSLLNANSKESIKKIIHAQQGSTDKLIGLFHPSK